VAKWPIISWYLDQSPASRNHWGVSHYMILLFVLLIFCKSPQLFTPPVPKKSLEGTRAPRFLSDRRWPPVNETSPLLACSQRPQFEQPGNWIGALGLRDGETVIWIWTPKEQWKKAWYSSILYVH
jgi:hypothetical protein